MKKLIGKAWIRNQCRPIYDCIHEIKRGKNKGKIKVIYLSGFNPDGKKIYRKIIIQQNHLVTCNPIEIKPPKKKWKRKVT